MQYFCGYGLHKVCCWRTGRGGSSIARSYHVLIDRGHQHIHTVDKKCEGSVETPDNSMLESHQS